MPDGVDDVLDARHLTRDAYKVLPAKIEPIGSIKTTFHQHCSPTVTTTRPARCPATSSSAISCPSSRRSTEDGEPASRRDSVGGREHQPVVAIAVDSRQPAETSPNVEVVAVVQGAETFSLSVAEDKRRHANIIVLVESVRWLIGTPGCCVGILVS